jgi:nucleoside-diphosphate-sugar epimerase
MNVAVTGASGLIGTETVKLLNSLGYQVLALGRNKPKLITIFNNSVEVVETDYSQDNLIHILSETDAIIHLAAVRQKSKPQELSKYVGGNILLTERLLEVAKINNIQKFCYSSSISVYGEHNQVPYQENQLLSPGTTYGISKLVCEYLTRIYHDQYGIKTVNLRFSKVFGYEDQSEQSFFLYQFIKQAMSKEKLIIWGSGEAKRNLIYVKDAASAIVRTLEKDDLTGTYNLGSGWEYSIYEIAQCVNSVFDNSGNLEFDSSKQINSRSFSLDSTLADMSMGWKAIWPLSPALEDMREKMLLKDRDG